MKKSFTKLLMLLGVFLLLGAGNAHADNLANMWLVGTNNGWTDKQDAYRFHENDRFYYLFLESLSGDFKISDGTGNNNWFGNKDGRGNLENDYSYWIGRGKGGDINLGNSHGNILVVMEKPLNNDGTIRIYLEEGGSLSHWWKLKGQFPNEKDWNEILLGNNSGTFSCTVRPQLFAGEFGIAEYIWSSSLNDDVEYFWYSSNETLTDGKTMTLTPKDGTTKYKLLGSNNYTFTWNTSNKTLSVNKATYPEAMYLAGHVNNGYWDPKNLVKLSKVKDESNPNANKYYNEYVEIGGFWSEKDSIMDPTKQRHKYDKATTNYVVLYDHKNLKLTDFDKGSKAWKYGSVASKNNHKDINGNLTNFEIKDAPNNVADLFYQQEEEVDNFVVNSGFYKVEVDLDNGTITFEPTQEIRKRTYVWYTGDNVANAELITGTVADENNSSAFHSYYDGFEIGDGAKHIIQTGIDVNTEHVLARLVEYTVWYKKSNESVAKGVKQRVGTLDDNTVAADAITGMPEESGYTKIMSTVDKYVNSDYSGYVTQINGSGYNSNHLLQLNRAGDYIITANIYPESNEHAITNEQGYVYIAKDDKVYDVTPTSLFVSIPTAEASQIVGVTDTAFDPSGTTTFENLISFDQNLVYDKDFSVEIEATNTDDWKTPENINDLTSSYQTALTESLYSQYSNIVATQGVVVDGFYIADKVAFEGASEGKFESSSSVYSYDLSVNVPCSGTYTLTVSPKAGGNYSFTAFNIDVKVYPNLYGIFGSDTGFNIEGYTFNRENPAGYTINFPYDTYKETIEKCVAYCPGTYFAEKFGENVMSEITPAYADQGTYPYPYYTVIDLSSLANGGQASLNIPVEKNGVNKNYQFIVKSSTNDFNVSTGVDTIGEAEDGEAVYFNLQGVKVANPEKGIYVKVQNGKASKVIL